MRKNLVTLVVLAFLAANLATVVAAPAAPLLSLSEPSALPLVAGPGSELTIDAAKAEKATVFVFLSARCPCSSSHEAKLRGYAAEYGPKGFNFVGVHANADETVDEARKHFEAPGLGFPVVRDDGRLADALGALKTPHVFVVTKDGRVVYSGGVDDSKEASRARQDFLRDALVEIAAGKSPRNRETRTLGCLIKRNAS